MKTVLITHEVKDFTDWRRVYDADEVNRTKAGFKTLGEYQSVDNPNKVTIIGEAPSVEVIQNYMTNPDLKDVMARAGVISQPDIRILNKV
jgi:quinol monooxygenase YgiN